MKPDPLRHRGTYTAELGSAIRDGEGGLKHVPGLLKRVLADDAWREFVTIRGDLVQHSSFGEFVQAQPLRGLGADLVLLQRMCADDPEALDAIDRASQRPPSLHAVNNVNGKPEGNARGQALRRLRKDRPDLHQRVLAKEISAHAAMVEAGLRPRTATIRVDTPDHAIRGLLKHFTGDQLRAALGDDL